MFVTRSQRPTLSAFIRQMKTYGKGRAEQTLISRRVSFKAMIPALFAMYITSLVFVHSWWYVIPAYLYCIGVVTNMLSAVNREGLPLALRLPLVYTLLHFCYGAGFIAGLLSVRYSKADESSGAVTIKRLKNFGSSW
jgi:cellulose synthase/poly-beta-1,6-N-acetylglucosamine synthase-like glycosyltransferase